MLATEVKKKIKVKMNKPVCLGLSILKISKILMYEFWYDYIKPKYLQNAKLCYIDTDSFTIQMISMKILQMMLKKILIYQIMKLIDHFLHVKNKKVVGLMKDKLKGKVMEEFGALRPKTYSYLMDNGKSNKKAKGTKKYIIK